MKKKFRFDKNLPTFTPSLLLILKRCLCFYTILFLLGIKQVKRPLYGFFNPCSFSLGRGRDNIYSTCYIFYCLCHGVLVYEYSHGFVILVNTLTTTLYHWYIFCL
jgi:hypothetical protein